jgi:penicillin-binding protein 1A
VLATEDRRFFDHFGIDFLGLARAMTENVKANQVVQGGSTITQQLAKNLFLTNERTIERKIKEAFLSLLARGQPVEEGNSPALSRPRLYGRRHLRGGGGRTVLFRQGHHRRLDRGISDAGRPVQGACPKYAPHINLPAARARANEVLSNMVQGDLMTEGQVIGARRNPASVVDWRPDAPDYFLDWAFDEVKRIAGGFDQHSLIVRTTLDPGMQEAADAAVETTLRQYGDRYRASQAALVLIENGGAVRAMVGGRDYGESQFNRASRALRQPGSSFKIYTYSLAMEKGMTPDSPIVDAPIRWGNWAPGNYSGGYSGRVDIKTALARSINTIPVRLAKERLGEDSIGQIMEMAKKFGVETPIRRDVTIPIGTSEVTVLDQATAYAVFPAGGYQSRRHGIAQIMNYNGDVLYDFNRDEPAPERVLSETAANYMNQMLTRVPYVGTARRAAVDGVLTAGKTGTTQAYRDAWFCGYTGNFAAAVWFGNDDYTSSNRMTGGSLPAMTFKRVMDYAHQGIELRAIPGVDNPLPEPRATPLVASASTDADGNALPQRQRTRSLNRETTDLLRGLMDKLNNAKPLGEAERLAAVEASLQPAAATAEQ